MFSHAGARHIPLGQWRVSSSGWADLSHTAGTVRSKIVREPSFCARRSRFKPPPEGASAPYESHHHLDPRGDDLFPVGVDWGLPQ